MASSDFLMVVTPDWQEVPSATNLVIAWGEEGLAGNIARGEWAVIEGMIESAGWLKPGAMLLDARMISVGSDPANRVRLWFRFGSYPAA